MKERVQEKKLLQKARFIIKAYIADVHITLMYSAQLRRGALAFYTASNTLPLYCYSQEPRKLHAFARLCLKRDIYS